MSDPFRIYDEVGKDGYPPEWHSTIKHLVREQADHRCVRCLHPYRSGENGNGEWSACDERCDHYGPLGVLRGNGAGVVTTHGEDRLPIYGHVTARNIADAMRQIDAGVPLVVARWRVLTVHHLTGHKADCRWWNLAALCQRCHLTVQGRVQMARVYPWEHSEWFQPYVAAYYASFYLGEELTREETVARLDELLALERQDVPA